MPDIQAKKFWQHLHNMRQSGLITIIEPPPLEVQGDWKVVLVVNGMTFEASAPRVQAARDAASFNALRILLGEDMANLRD